jgi:hypothetical protein
MLHPDSEPAIEDTPLRRLIAAGITLLKRLEATRSTRFQRWLAIGLNAFLLALLSSIIYSNRDDLPLVEQLLDPLRIGACLLIYLISFLIQSAIWSDMMGYGHGDRLEGLEYYIRTTFMGRLPGGVWKILGRMTIYRTPRLPRRAILAINLVELLLLLITAGLILLALSPLAVWMQLAGFGLLLLTLWLLASHSARFAPTLGAGRRLLRWPLWCTGYIVNWLSGGVLIYLVLAPFGSSAPLSFAGATILWCSAGSVGLLLQILPLSALFRDATLVALLRPLMPLHRAIVAAFALRLVLMASELICGWGLIGLTQLFERVSNHRRAGTAVAEHEAPAEHHNENNALR